MCFVSGFRPIEGVVPPHSTVKILQRNYSGVSSVLKEHWDMPTIEDKRNAMLRKPTAIATMTQTYIVEDLNTHK